MTVPTDPAATPAAPEPTQVAAFPTPTPDPTPQAVPVEEPVVPEPEADPTVTPSNLVKVELDDLKHIYDQLVAASTWHTGAKSRVFTDAAALIERFFKKDTVEEGTTPAPATSTTQVG
jgi:hypothetical protein